MSAQKVTWEEKRQINRRNRELLEAELLAKRLTFESRPYEAHIQFSNFCNMSCVMCWDGANPPLLKMSPQVLEKLATQIAPELIVMTPHDGSEPLAVTWDETRKIAEDYSVHIALTTNAQLLDEKKFDQMKDLVEHIILSIDSHIPEVFEKIRPGAKADVVYANVKRTAALCKEHGIECIVQAVFMTENAPHLPDTVAYMADAGIENFYVIQLIDVNRRSRHLDPTLHFSHEYIEGIKQRCIAVAEEKQINFDWWLDDHTHYDFRDQEKMTPPLASRHEAHLWDERMKLIAPGYCRYAYDRIRVLATGEVGPCGLDSGRELTIGDLRHQDFDEIWNGPTARDLRRAHYTWDYPPLCATCRFVDRLPDQKILPFVREFLGQLGKLPREVDHTVVLESPAHMERVTDPPVIRFRAPRHLERFLICFALGGQADVPFESCELDAVRGPDGVWEAALPEDLWRRLASNLGFWWIVVGACHDPELPIVRSRVRCVIRHEHMPRIEGSDLRYADDGHRASTYLGGERKAGWDERDALPARPVLAERLIERRDVRGKPRSAARKSESLSETLRREADELLGYGGQHKQHSRTFYEDTENVFPEFAKRGKGGVLVDVEGRRFVDWVNGGGPVLLGYRHPAVEKAIRAQLAEGPTLSVMHPVELDVARLLTEMIPGAEQVAFGKNGSDAVAAAVRLARAVTGREAIVQYGVHGFHDWHMAKFPGVAGIPGALRSLVHPFPYNDLDALAYVLENFSGRVAAVLMEPVTTELPEPGYLEGVAELAHRHGALLVFDEMITGFRLANGGAQELYGVVPDLACFGKSLANGMPLAAIVGRQEYMERLPQIAYGMTFRGETLSLAAARAVLETLRDEPVTEHLARIGAEVRSAFDSACAKHGVTAALEGPESRMTFAFASAHGVPGERWRTLFTRECAKERVLTNGNILPSYGHDEAAVARTAKAFDRASKRIAAQIQTAGEAIWQALAAGCAAHGTPITSDGGLPNGFLDVVEVGGGALHVRGWFLTRDGTPADTVEIHGPGGRMIGAEKIKRPDLATAFPDAARASGGGFETWLPADQFAANGHYDCTLRVVRQGEPHFSCHIVAGRDGGSHAIPRWEDGTLRI